jgi:hypothetical protein
MDAGERRIRWLLAGVGAGCFVLLMTLEIATESDELSLEDVLVDALALLLTIGAAVGVALLTQRMHRQHEERIGLMRDLELARAEGNGWRPLASRRTEEVRDKLYLHQRAGSGK